MFRFCTSGQGAGSGGSSGVLGVDMKWSQHIQAHGITIDSWRARMKSKNVAYLLWFFLGWWGIHRFYCRKWVSGFIWLFTFGLLGVGWFVDAILTSKMVDEANGLASAQVSGNLKQELRRFGITAAVILGVVAILGIGFWISEKFDKKSPEQKAQDELEAKHSDYRELKKDYPCMWLDGKVVPIQVEWASDGLVIAMPKTYGFGATRFRQQTKTIAKDNFRRLSEEFEGNYFMNIGVKIWSGPSTSFSSYHISIPKRAIPADFLQNPASQSTVSPNKALP